MPPHMVRLFTLPLFHLTEAESGYETKNKLYECHYIIKKVFKPSGVDGLKAAKQKGTAQWMGWAATSCIQPDMIIRAFLLLTRAPFGRIGMIKTYICKQDSPSPSFSKDTLILP
ncbi:hypothetical protein B0T18DRAFT_224733 [Schizothecium vesticola]|uniref:Uncharacterized protein n=1 Tax=Schizothecium vesticola TaxID=314040 RepID=A0AA40K030_9PEZI|nr:hypothetical protein B0T18DRAFT_224733 [Schizothecium vesticola]